VDYESGPDWFNITRSRTDVDFVDYTYRELTINVVDSGGHAISPILPVFPMPAAD
jgi:hypothetical protein